MDRTKLSARPWTGVAVALGLISLLELVFLRQPIGTASTWQIGVFAVLSAITAGKRVLLWPRRLHRRPIDLPLDHLVIFAALLHLGSQCALLVGVIAVVASSVTAIRSAAVSIIERVAGICTTIAASSSAFALLNRGFLEIEFPRSIPALVAGLIIYHAVNTIFVTKSSIPHQADFFSALRRALIRRAPGVFLSGVISTCAMMLFGNDIGIVILFDLPIIMLMRKAYISTASRTAEKQKHIEDLQANQERLAELYLATIRSLALAIDAKDQYTHQHILRVQQYAVAIAEHMGLEGAEFEAVRTGALLHDIGKLGVPEYVLLKPGRLTDDEFDKIKLHPEIGAAILGPVQFPWPVLPVVKYHHERWDGLGYPEGLRGEEIPLTARIMSVADVYDALTSTRSYRMAWTHERASKAIIDGAGTQFDPDVVEAFQAIIDSVVQKMAETGQGPLVDRKRQRRARQNDESAKAARAIGKAASELWAMYEVVQTLSSSLGLQDTLDILGRKLLEVFPGATCLFLFRTANQDRLKVRGAVGPNFEYFQGATSLNDDSVSLRVLRTRESYVGSYDHDDLMLNAVFASNWDQKQSALIVPVIYRGEPIGTINLFQPEFDAFGDEDRELLESVAERASMALYNGLLHDRSAADLEVDPLTGVKNVWHVTQQIEELVGPNSGRTQFALMCLDLDSFAAINDCFGVLRGDEILRDFAALVRTSVGPGGSVARYAGDGFIVLIEGAERRDADMAIDRIRRSLAEFGSSLVHEKLGNLRIDFSFGIAMYPADAKDCASIFKAAESNLQQQQSEKMLGVLMTPGPESGDETDVIRRAA